MGEGQERALVYRMGSRCIGTHRAVDRAFTLAGANAHFAIISTTLASAFIARCRAMLDPLPLTAMPADKALARFAGRLRVLFVLDQRHLAASGAAPEKVHLPYAMGNLPEDDMRRIKRA